MNPDDPNLSKRRKGARRIQNAQTRVRKELKRHGADVPRSIWDSFGKVQEKADAAEREPSEINLLVASSAQDVFKDRYVGPGMKTTLGGYHGTKNRETRIAFAVNWLERNPSGKKSDLARALVQAFEELNFGGALTFIRRHLDFPENSKKSRN